MSTLCSVQLMGVNPWVQSPWSARKCNVRGRLKYSSACSTALIKTKYHIRENIALFYTHIVVSTASAGVVRVWRLDMALSPASFFCASAPS